ncbi:hypothetical protein GCM10011533_21910 [Streptosporangium jomthongense]|uniref:Transcriptional regulator n=1 Tax=Marinobacter aromaticivorans TaxID=1494078 RepID=A0ABW2IWM1_9GAMM|nr:hypothetical protein [Marinobacter aromaticivorans]GGE69129.1 hypothetical protein GCM10011533_21910 [Streptosporangium jomthongense]
MEKQKTCHESRAKDFLRLSPEELRDKYPDDEEIQGALAQVTLARKMYHSQNGTLENFAHIETELVKRIALNLAQGLPVLVSNIEEVFRDTSL